jgi:acyl-coenzyme A synthetase/AMP-(fatty) acid ligase
MSADLYALFERTVRARPGHPALLRGAQSVSFAELQQHSLALADGLRKAGVRPGERVIVWIENSAETAAVLLGCWALGAVPVLMDHSEPQAHLANAVRRVAPVLIVHPGHAVPPSGDCAVPMRAVDSLAGSPQPRPATAARLPTDPASIVFTSGSTGDPKGVTQSHGSLARGCQAVGGYLGLRAEDRLLCPIPWAFDYGYGQLLTTCLFGITQVIPDAFNPFGICSAIATQRPSVLAGLPSLFTYLFRGVSPIRDTDLSSIRTVTNTGGTIPGPVLDDLFAALPQAEVFLNYGLTESYRTACLPPALARRHPTSIGAGIPGVEVVVLREDDTRCAAGEEGQIVHRGDYLFSGYWGDPEATARALRPDPRLPAGAPTRHPVLYTGDFGVIDEQGLLYFRGRRDHQLKAMGVRVNAAEIEALIHASGLATELAVIGVPHDLLGHEIWCFAVPASGTADGLRALRAWCHAQLSPYLQPRRFEELPALPKTRNNKIDYPELRRLAAARPSASVVQ